MEASNNTNSTQPRSSIEMGQLCLLTNWRPHPLTFVSHLMLSLVATRDAPTHANIDQQQQKGTETERLRGGGAARVCLVYLVIVVFWTTALNIDSAGLLPRRSRMLLLFRYVCLIVRVTRSTARLTLYGRELQSLLRMLRGYHM